mgnify:CR=1 FL=1
MSASDIGNNVIFKKQLGLNYEIDQKYVGLKMKENNILSVNFRIPGDLKDEVEGYFKRFKMGEPILVDIGGTGDIRCDFKGISPVLKNKNGTEMIVDCNCGCDEGIRIRIDKDDFDYYCFLTY